MPMSFDDPDPIEQEMGVRVENMTPDELVAYIKMYHRAFDLDLAVEGMRERAVFQGMQRTYGQRTAGRIVKWVFYEHKGKYRDRTVGFFDFAKGSKWWVDQMHLEMQTHLRRAESRQAKTNSSASVEVLNF